MLDLAPATMRGPVESVCARNYIMSGVERATSESREAALPELVKPAPRRTSDTPGALAAFLAGVRRGAFDPRLVVGLLLVVGAVVWALARGLEFYGVSPVNLAYDLDQPPLLLAIVGGWFVYRSRRT
jgi:hypothetical protein